MANETAAPAAPRANGQAYPITDHSYDVVVVGGGGAGLRATFGMAQKGLTAKPLFFRTYSPVSGPRPRSLTELSSPLRVLPPRGCLNRKIQNPKSSGDAETDSKASSAAAATLPGRNEIHFHHNLPTDGITFDAAGNVKTYNNGSYRWHHSLSVQD